MMAACFADRAAERRYGPVPEAEGDLNADGALTVSDVVLLQKWLLAVPNTYGNTAQLQNCGKSSIIREWTDR